MDLPDDDDVPLPAICEGCGRMFASRIGLSGGVHVSGIKYGPCPHCGGVGAIPDGYYRKVGRALQVLATVRDRDSLENLRIVFERAQNAQTDREQIAAAIIAAGPQFESLQNYLPTNRSELYSFITLIIAALAFLVQLYTANQNPPAPSITQIFNTITQQTTIVNEGPRPETPKQERNAPCACGSGKKYKKCCGK